MKKFLIGLMVAVFAVTTVFAAGCSKSEEITGTLYSLETAYENGWLTRDDLMSIAYYHHRGRAYNENIMPEDYEPIPKTPEKLSSKIEKAIRTTVWHMLHGEEKPKKERFKNIEITRYYGCYNNCIAIKYSTEVYVPAIWYEEIDGITFHFSSTSIKIWIQEEN